MSGSEQEIPLLLFVGDKVAVEYMVGSREARTAYDVIVVGSGIAGLSAALAAVESGLSVVVFEKDRLIGGGTALSYGGLWAGCNHLAGAAGIADDRQAVHDYMEFVAGGAADPELMNTFIDKAPVATEFFARCGVKFQLSRGLADHYYPVVPGSISEGRMFEAEPISVNALGDLGSKIRDSVIDPRIVTVEEICRWGGMVNHKNWDQTTIEHRRKHSVKANGPALVTYFVKALLKHRVPIVLDTPVEGVEREDENIVGVRISGGKVITARRGVVLATGGWEGDPIAAREFEGLPEARSSFPSAVSGDGWKLAGAVGASTALIRNSLATILGFFVPSEDGGEPEFRQSQILECVCPHTVIVNAHGERFSDETYFQGTVEALRHYDIWRREYRNSPCYLIFDAQYVKTFSFCGAPVGVKPPNWVTSADNLAELASKLGIISDRFQTTIARFNDFSREGVDHDFQRGAKRFGLTDRDAIKGGNSVNQRLGTLEIAPFYGIRLYPGVFVSSGGIRMNRHGQAVGTNGQTIPKLYVIGNAAAHLEYGVGYQAGYSLTSGMTFGYLAAQHMAGAN